MEFFEDNIEEVAWVIRASHVVENALTAALAAGAVLLYLDNIREDASVVHASRDAVGNVLRLFSVGVVGAVVALIDKVSQSWEVTFALGQEHAELSRQCAEPRKTKDCLEVRTHYLTASQKKVQELEQRNEEVKEKMKQQNERYEQKIRELEEINIKLEKEILDQRNKLKYAAELDRYAMGPAAPRGICLVINNFNFFGKEERQGAELDEEAIASLFHELHFIVEIRQNLGGREMLDVAQEMAAIDHSNYEAFVFCIMSHGDKKDVIYGVDDRKAGVEDLMSEFTPTNCRTLENKPKLFFIQACRGQKSDSRRNRLSSVLSSNIADDGIQIMHSPDADLANGLSAREADFLLAFATVPGYKAWRSKQVGSWFIQVLVDVIRTYHCRHHLLDMLTEVNKRVAAIANDYPDDDLSFQVPAPTHTLRAQVFL